VILPTISDNTLSPSLLQTERDLSVLRRDPERTQKGAQDFRNVLDAVDLGADVLELSASPVGPGSVPAGSALFQSHAGALAQDPARLDRGPLPEEQAPLRVSGVGSTTAASAFTGEQSLASNPYQTLVPGLEPTRTASGVTGSEDFSGIYDARTGQVIRRVGARLDVKG